MCRTVASWWDLSIHFRLEWVLLSICRVCKLFCTTWFQVLHVIPLSAARSITKFLHFQLSSHFLFFLCGQTTWDAFAGWPLKYPCICSLTRISSEGHCSDRLMLHIILAICISIRWSLQVSSKLTGHASLLYNIALLTQALGNCDSFYVKTLLM